MYLGAADMLGLKPEEVMMVAAHKPDLRAAAKCGLKTAFVQRPREHGRGGAPDLAPEPDFTVNAGSFLDLAGQLGC
jgi:2-haloacid dehalogenase